MPSLLGDAQRSLAVLVGQAGVGPGPEEEPHALALVLDDAVVQGRVAFPGLLVQDAGVLDDEVDDVKRVAGLVGDGVVKTSFSEFLKKRSEIRSDAKFVVKLGQSWFREPLAGD